MLLQSENLGEMNGTEADGTPSGTYCKLCYLDGAFTGPECTLQEMQEIVDAALRRHKAGFTYRLFVKRSLRKLERWR
jgi:hypothetical protein